MQKDRKGEKYMRDCDWMEAEREAENEQVIYPCPFCQELHGGKDGQYIDVGPWVTGTHPGTDWVECESCGASGPHQKQHRKKSGASRRARLAWNRWAASAVDMVTAMQSALRAKARKKVKK